MKKDIKDFAKIEEISRRVRLMTSKDAEHVYEAIEHTQDEITELMSLLKNEKLREASRPELFGKTNTHIETMILREAAKLERLMILEGVSAKDFFTVQKHFRSMIRASNVVSNWMKGSSLSNSMTNLRTEGLELLNTLYEHIKELEKNDLSQLQGVDKHQMQRDQGTAQLRDRFVKVYTDFAVLFRGTMALADMFSDDPASIGGYNEIKAIMASLQTEDQMSEPLGQALAYVDHSAAEVNPKKSFFGGKQKGLTAKFQQAVAKAITSASPGFAKTVNVNELIQYMMTKSMDQLMAVFGRFNDFVASDVDTDYLLSVTKNPRTIGSMFKAVFDAFGAGKMGGFHGR